MRTPHNESLTSDNPEGTDSRASGSERRCVLTGTSAARETLVRLAISPDGLVLPDAQEKAPGRGAWFGGTRAQLEDAGVSVVDVARCTRESPDLYSFRRDGEQAGRLAGLVRLRAPGAAA